MIDRERFSPDELVEPAMTTCLGCGGEYPEGGAHDCLPDDPGGRIKRRLEAEIVALRRERDGLRARLAELTGVGGATTSDDGGEW